MPDIQIFPMGVKRVIRAYAGRIDRVAAEVGGHVGWNSMFGCGAFGCVYPVWPDDGSQMMRYVLKISLDPTEGPVVAAIMKTGLDKRLNGLVRWERIYQIPEKILDRRPFTWIILREQVRPFNHLDMKNVLEKQSPPDVSWFRCDQRWISAPYEFNDAMRRVIRTGAHRRPPETGALWRVHKFLGELYDLEASYYVAEAIEELMRHDIYLADVHIGNVGHRILDWSSVGGQEPHTVDWRCSGKRLKPGGDPVSQTDFQHVDTHYAPLLIFDPGHGEVEGGGPDIAQLWEQAQTQLPNLRAVLHGIPEI